MMPSKTTKLGHQKWCDVDRSQRVLCRDFGCRGSVVRTPIGEMWLTVGAGDVPDIAIDPTLLTAITPEQAVRLAGSLIARARIALAGPRPASLPDVATDDVIRNLHLTEVLDMMTDLGSAAHHDLAECSRPVRWRPTVEALIRRSKARKLVAS